MIDALLYTIDAISRKGLKAFAEEWSRREGLESTADASGPAGERGAYQFSNGDAARLRSETYTRLGQEAELIAHVAAYVAAYGMARGLLVARGLHCMGGIYFSVVRAIHPFDGADGRKPMAIPSDMLKSHLLMAGLDRRYAHRALVPTDCLRAYLRGAGGESPASIPRAVVDLVLRTGKDTCFI